MPTTGIEPVPQSFINESMHQYTMLAYILSCTCITKQVGHNSGHDMYKHVPECSDIHVDQVNHLCA